MTTKKRIKAVLTLAVVSMALLALPAAADIPGPNDLPDPDSIPPDGTKPVKVFILSGQSNMVGMAKIDSLGTPGTLKTITITDGMFPHLIDDEGAWTVRNDVMYRGVISAIGNGPLTPGVLDNSNFGPELGFGHVMGYYYDEPVIVLKSSIGNRSISWDYAPPSTERFDYDGKTYAGYGDSPKNWPIGEGPTPFNWYAGKQWDDCFLHEDDMGPAMTWTTGKYFYRDKIQLRHNGVIYISKAEHTADDGGTPGVDDGAGDTEPGIGTDASTYWDVHQITNVVDVLDNFATQYPEYAAQGFEIAGFGWWQGHKDQSEPHASRYELNLVNFIKDIRAYYEDRYPANITSNAPFVLATIGFGGWDLSGAGLTVANGQLAVSGETGNYPEFEDNVKTIESRGFWRDSSISPTTDGPHYNRNAETYYRVGDALGRAMVELLTPYSVDAGDDMITWSGEPVELDATIQEGVTVVSYGWSAEPNDGVVFDSNSIEDPNVTITKPALTLTAVSIANPGFEVPVKADGDYSNDFTDCPGWNAVDANTLGGVWNPGLVGYTGYGGNAPEGENVAYVTKSGIEQVLTEKLAAETTYTLTVKVGNTAGVAWAGYKVQLLADGTLLSEDDNTMTIDPNTFKTSTVTYPYDPCDSALLGQPLQIRLLCLDANEVDFDDVELTAEGPAPEPYAVKLTLTVNDGENPAVTDAVRIDVYDDACKATIGKGLGADNLGDFDENCITNFGDLAVMATKWLNDTGLTEPVAK